MGKRNTFDVVILGGGPAGSAAALCLIRLGYQVALIEQDIFPRPQIGESLSPGVHSIFEYLDAYEIIEKNSYIKELPAHVIWETREMNTITAEQRGPGIVVNRATLDMDLLELAEVRGLKRYQPAQVRECIKNMDGWNIHISCDNNNISFSAKIILDARGRKGIPLSERMLTAPSTIALYSHVPEVYLPRATMIEAAGNSWLWGSPLPDRSYRVMVFTSPEYLKNKIAGRFFLDQLTNSSLFQSVSRTNLLVGLQSCLVHNYCNREPWRENYITLGETAFSLDPLSSTGVEKSMRFSLQTAIAVNTLLQSGGNSEISKKYYENQMAETVARHMVWTSSYYNEAWPGQGSPFWKERSRAGILNDGINTQFYNKLTICLDAFAKDISSINKIKTHEQNLVKNVWHEKICISPDLRYSNATCVVNNLLEIKKVICHPGLEGETAYLEEEEIIPMLAMVAQGETLVGIVGKWSRLMPVQKSIRIAQFLIIQGILLVVKR